MASLLYLSDAIGKITLEVATNFCVDVVWEVVIKYLMVRVLAHAVFIDLSSLAVERLSVHTTIVFFTIAIPDIRHGVCSSQVLIAISLLNEFASIFF